MMNTLVVIYGELRTGGIEDFLFGLMKYAIKKSYRVIWFHKEHAIVADHYKDVLDNIEKIQCGRRKTGTWFHDNVKFAQDERVTVLSFTPFDMDASTILREENQSVQFSVFFILANTTGRFIYPEISFSPIGKRIISKIMKKSAKQWNSEDVIRAYSLQQLESYEKHYQIVIENPQDHIVPKVESPKELDLDSLEKRKHRELFNIISVSRFTFPHKNYLLGLIDDFVTIRHERGKVALHIIGYGNDREVLEQKISNLSVTDQSDIHLYGEKSPNEIDDIMTNMHLNISTAGSVWCGARNGVVSLPARNYCDETCEVYGYLPQSAKMTTSLEKGMPGIDFIRELISMSDSDYKEKCLESYRAVSSNVPDPEYIFRQTNKDHQSNKNRHVLFSTIYVLSEIMVKLKIILGN